VKEEHGSWAEFLIVVGFAKFVKFVVKFSLQVRVSTPEDFDSDAD
jgi:hypothetical protein